MFVGWNGTRRQGWIYLASRTLNTRPLFAIFTQELTWSGMELDARAV